MAVSPLPSSPPLQSEPTLLLPAPASVDVVDVGLKQSAPPPTALQVQQMGSKLLICHYVIILPAK